MIDIVYIIKYILIGFLVFLGLGLSLLFGFYVSYMWDKDKTNKDFIKQLINWKRYKVK